MEKDLREILIAEVVSITGGVFAGYLLAYQTQKISLVPGLFILLPGFLAERGNISGSLSARLSSKLHLGKITPSLKDNKILKENILASFILGIGVSFILGVLAFLFNLAIFNQFLPKIILISLLASVLSQLIMIPTTALTCFFLFKKGFDPDNVMSPIVSTLGDFISVFSLILAIWVI